MKTRWEFHFKAWDIFFGKEHSFVGTLGPSLDQDSSTVKDGFDFELRLVPADTRSGSPPHQTGRILVTIPGRPENTEEAAYVIVSRMKDRVCFPRGRMEILGGFICATQLPETAEEEAEVGDRPHLVRLVFQNAEDVPVFEPKRLVNLHVDPQHQPLLEQVNAARQLSNPVEAFLAFFKVLEKAYASDREGNLIRALADSDELFALVRQVVRPTEKEAIDRDEFTALISDLVRIRDRCAHLRGTFGYAPADPRVTIEVEPHLGLVGELAHRCVQARVVRSE